MCRRNWRLKWNNRRSRCCLHTLIFVGPLEKLFLIKLPTSAVHDISRSFDFLFMTFPGVLIFLRPKIPTATPFGGGGTMFTLIRAIVLAQNYISEQSAIRSNTVSTMFTAGKKNAVVLMCRRNWRLKWNNRRSRCCLHTLIFVGPLEKLPPNVPHKTPNPGGMGWS